MAAAAAPAAAPVAADASAPSDTKSAAAADAAAPAAAVETVSGPHETFRRDYLPPPFLVPNVTLAVDLEDEGESRVQATLQVHRNPAYAALAGAPASELKLDAHASALRLESVSIGDRVLAASEFRVEEKHIVVSGAVLPADETPFTLTTVVRERPEDNKALEGLYKSGGNFCTQMEAEGFRRFAPHFDRPDVMARYRVTVSADKSKYPVLLSNGNLVESGDGPEGSGRHFAVWEDPWPKATYLFALVAGNLGFVEDSFTTMSGRRVTLRVYAREADVPRCHHALDCVKKSMKWDEETFGREYDLDVFNIVAVSDFNMGAMENKGLNIFNTKYVLADPASATDTDFELVLGVIGHEYFHNWSGDRVTCRDWFQLSLKEGFTVFRDQEFSSDMNSRPMKRIGDVNTLRSSQFNEDAGPMSHPVRPDAVITIDNFYTVTVYEKGAEVVRMYDTILSRAGFRRGSDLYFARHDGQAVACDDFCSAMEDANWADLPAVAREFERSPKTADDDAWVDPPYTRTGPRPLTQFRRWYSVAGTPNVRVRSVFDHEAKTLTLTLSQSVPPTPKQPGPKPALHIPIAVGVLGPDGKDLPLRLRADPAHWADRWGGRAPEGATTVVLHLTEPEQTFVFEGVELPPAGEAAAAAGIVAPTEPVLSVLRNFSAPVRLTLEGDSRAQQLFRFAFDSDAFNRWEASNQLALHLITDQVPRTSPKDPKDATLPAPCDVPVDHAAVAEFHAAIRLLLRAAAAGEAGLDPKLVAHVLALPSLNTILQEVEKRDGAVDPPAVARTATRFRTQLARALEPELVAIYRSFTERLAGRSYALTEADKGMRALRNSVLGYLMLPHCEEPGSLAAAVEEGRAAVGGGAGASASASASATGFDAVEAARAQLGWATNMTDEIAALSCLAGLPVGHAVREAGMFSFASKWADNALVMDKWFRVQATNVTAAALPKLREHPSFDLKNPNKVYSLIWAFGLGNFRSFHDHSGAGYDVIADFVAEVDTFNPQVAARLAGSFTSARMVIPELALKMKERIDRLLAGKLSENTFEVLKNTRESIVARGL